MLGNPMNIPPVSIGAAKQALIAQYADRTLRRRASMLWGTRGVGKSSIVHQVAAHCGVPLIDLRLTTIEPVDIRGAIYADDDQERDPQGAADRAGRAEEGPRGGQRFRAAVRREGSGRDAREPGNQARGRGRGHRSARARCASNRWRTVFPSSRTSSAGIDPASAGHDSLRQLRRTIVPR